MLGMARIFRIRAEQNNGVGLKEREPEIVQQEERLKTQMENMSPEEQQSLSQLYMFLVQNPKHGITVRSWADVQILWTQYQTLIWRPAELLNGRMAMVGFSAAIINEAITGQTLWRQLALAPFAYLTAYSLVIVGALLNRAAGSPNEGISIGPIKFSRTAELINGRGAMLGYVILAYVERQQELRRFAIALYEQLQHAQLPGVNA
ncbi:hypothetical protein WJX81_000685 [Elliptochloris bilobata]|uniref:Uncharacterized protein n=1 Tax=Elliptochloris bilobata TaxID=381761 RepID=A0AAW1QXE1_9CHLO